MNVPPPTASVNRATVSDARGSHAHRRDTAPEHIGLVVSRVVAAILDRARQGRPPGTAGLQADDGRCPRCGRGNGYLPPADDLLCEVCQLEIVNAAEEAHRRQAIAIAEVQR